MHSFASAFCDAFVVINPICPERSFAQGMPAVRSRSDRTTSVLNVGQKRLPDDTFLTPPYEGGKRFVERLVEHGDMKWNNHTSI